MRTQFLLLGLAALGACANPAPGNDSTPAAPDELDVCRARLQWSTGPLLPVGVDHHATFVSDVSGSPFLYVAGGFDGDEATGQPRREVWRASIHDDGTLDEFTETTPMPQARAGSGMVVVDRDVWLAGGFVGNGFSGKVLHGTIADTGEIDSWSEGPSLPGARFHSTLVASGRRIYSVGGVDGSGDAHVDVWSADTTDPDTMVWEPMTSLPEPRSHHASYVDGGFLYAIGGLAGNPFVNDTTNHTDAIRAQIQPDGALGPWTDVASDIPFDFSTHAITAVDGCAFVVGGGAGDQFDPSAHVFRVTLGDAGFEGVLVDDDLPAAYTHRHQAPFYRGHLYAVGGSVSHISMPDVFIGEFVE